nr:hypothetical protein [Tanacetum cinerariifolium]
NKVKTFKLRRLKKVRTSQRVKTSDDTIIEDVSNQRRMIVELDRDEGVELIGRKFNFSKYIFDSLVRNVDSNSTFYIYPRFIQLLIQNQIGDLSTHTTKYISPALTQKVFVNMKRIWKGFSGVETPLFEGMLVGREDVEADIGEKQIPDHTDVAAAQEVVSIAALEDVLTAVLEDVNDEFIPSPAPP